MISSLSRAYERTEEMQKRGIFARANRGRGQRTGIKRYNCKRKMRIHGKMTIFCGENEKCPLSACKMAADTLY